MPCDSIISLFTFVIFPSIDFSVLITADSLTSWFEDFIKRTDLLQIHIHSLRHTNATLMIAGGKDILTVSKRLGDAQTSTTTNIYPHAIR